MTDKHTENAEPKTSTEAPKSPDEMPDLRTADQYRAEIDAGHTGDKHPHSDVATVPFGADAEAGGHPTPAEALKKARDQEVRRHDGSGADDTDA